MSPTASAEMEQVYDYVRAENKKKEMKILNKESIVLAETLGAGNFGRVCRGTYKYQLKNKDWKEVPVAVKELKSGDSPSAEVQNTTSQSNRFNLFRLRSLNEE